MPGSTPRGYPYPLGTEIADGSANIEALARAVDADAAAINTELGAVGAYAIASGPLSSGVSGANIVNLTAITEQAGAAWTLSAGQLVAPYSGTYLLIYHGQITGTQTQVWVGPSSTLMTNVQIAGQQNPSLQSTVIGFVAAGGKFGKGTIYTAPTAGATGTLWLRAIFMGNPG